MQHILLKHTTIMVRKLLKRKLKVVALKKLKTIKRTQTSLGEWAAKQLVNTQSRTCLIRYPKTKNTQTIFWPRHVACAAMAYPA